MSTVVLTQEEWVAENSKDGEPLYLGDNRMLLSSGAETNWLGVRMGVPLGLTALLKRAEYHRKKREEAESAFAALRHSLTARDRYSRHGSWTWPTSPPDFGPPPGPPYSAAACLKRLKEIFKRHQAKEEELNGQLFDMKGGWEGSEIGLSRAEYEAAEARMKIVREANAKELAERQKTIEAISLEEPDEKPK